MGLFCAVIRRDSLSLLRFPFFSLGKISLEISIQLFFFLIFFSSYCCSFDPCVVSGRCNQSFFFVLINIVLETSYRCIDAMFNAGKFFFLDIYRLSTSFLGYKP